MANEQHLNILSQGVKFWNTWRQENPMINPDLSNSDLKKKDLTGIDLSFANLQNVDLSDADLTNANLERANVKNGYLEGVSLGEAFLNHADFEGADLVRAFMIYCSLKGANLKKVDLAMAILASAVLDDAILDDAQLYETQRSDWSIKNIRCNRVYWDSEGKIPTDYYPGEFEKLHGKTIKVSIKYKGGISEFEYFTLPLLLKHINDKYPDCPIELESINIIPGKSAEAVIAVYDTNKRNPEELLKEIESFSKDIPIIQKMLASYRDSELVMKGMYQQLTSDFQSLLKELPNMSNDTYHIIGGNQGVVGRKGGATNFLQLSDESQHNRADIDLHALIYGLQELRTAMRQEANTPDHDVSIGEVAAAQTAAAAGNGSKVIEHLKNAGKWAFDVSTKIGISVATAAIKTALGV